MMAPNFDGIFGLAALSFLLTPLAIWKLIDIFIWVFSNLSISWG
jgi:hypothetical protein